jgi:hypothetical protein
LPYCLTMEVHEQLQLGIGHGFLLLREHDWYNPQSNMLPPSFSSLAHAHIDG